MVDIEHVRDTRGGRGYLIPGIVLLVLGVVGIVTYIYLASTETPGAGQEQGALQGGLIVVSGLLAGVGALLTFLGALKHRRRAEHIEQPE